MRFWTNVKRRFRRAVQDYRMWHVDERCKPEGCDCPCGYCKHDRRHVPGGVGTQ